MNDVLRRIFDELEKQGKDPTNMCKELGIASSTFFTWKTKDKIPATKALQKISKYLGVSIDYLINGTFDNNSSLELTSKDEKDIAKRLEQTLEDLEHGQDGLMFSGEPLDEETKELLKASLENSIRIAKINAKEKFTPKKYRK